MYLKLAFRRLFKTPFVTAVAIVSLALGIGANAAIFSLFEQTLLRAGDGRAIGAVARVGGGHHAGDAPEHVVGRLAVRQVAAPQHGERVVGPRGHSRTA